MKETCLLLKTEDNRTFFTDENNYPLLVEFSRTFKAEVAVVKAPDAKILAMEDLAKSICSPELREAPKYEVVKVLLNPKDIIQPRVTPDSTKHIGEFIRKELLNGSAVLISDLVNKWPDIPRTTIQRHMLRVKQQLALENYQVLREKPGQYRIRTVKSGSWD